MLHRYKENFPQMSEGVWIAPDSTVIGEVNIGKDSSIWFGCVVRGDIHRIDIGNRVNIQDLSMIHVTHYKKPDKSDGHPTEIGDDVTIGHKVMLHGCKIGKACLIGMNATILDGSEIGDESIVGAGSVVTMGKKFPPRSMIIGSPAKVVRSLSNEEVESLYKSSDNYVKFKNEYIENLR